MTDEKPLHVRVAEALRAGPCRMAPQAPKVGAQVVTDYGAGRVMTLPELLRAIDAREIPLEIVEAPGNTIDPVYRAAGWTLVGFEDCGYWKYLARAIAPGGWRLECPVYGQLSCGAEDALFVQRYYPAHPEDWGYPEDHAR